LLCYFCDVIAEPTSTYYRSPIGVLKIKSIPGFISDILFYADDPAKEQPAATTVENDLTVTNCIQQLDEYFAGKRKQFDLPLKQTGTDFQQHVWAELLNIPYGQTISYLELSKKISNIKAIRACGTANGRNHLAILVPCHRVIGSNGKLVGYSGELWRKKWLLLHEVNYTVPTKTLF
jgi:methylated-DNA-[protein]-cysteine S-methyltransferase